MAGRFFKVFVDAPLEVCEAPDTDELYQRARLGLANDVAGISDAYEPPLHPEATIRGKSETPVEGAARILARLEEPGWVPAAPAPGRDPDGAVARAQLRALQNR
jgi:adenylylsulfate kinase-like enzyme